MRSSGKSYLFVDGSNLYAGQFKLFGPKKYLDFRKFIKETERKIGVEFSKIYFYASYSPKSKKPTKKEKLYLKNEALFYRSVKRTKNTVFFRGYRSKTSGREKEVDVRLAADLVAFAYQKKYEKLYLLSGDADFMAALENVKPLKIPIEVLCIENKVMFKSILFYRTTILSFTREQILFKKIRKRPKIIKLECEGLVKQF